MKKQDAPAMRLDWLQRKHDKALADYHFANGFHAGLECALLAIKEGRDILGLSIDAGEAQIR